MIVRNVGKQCIYSDRVTTGSVLGRQLPITQRRERQPGRPVSHAVHNMLRKSILICGRFRHRICVSTCVASRKLATPSIVNG